MKEISLFAPKSKEFFYQLTAEGYDRYGINLSNMRAFALQPQEPNPVYFRVIPWPKDRS